MFDGKEGHDKETEFQTVHTSGQNQSSNRSCVKVKGDRIKSDLV